VLLAAALVLFGVVTVVSFGRLPSDLHPHWWPVPLVLIVTTPLTVLLNAAEFRAMGAINGHTVRWLPAIRLTVVAGAANLLPLPGGVVIRTQALHQRGSTYRHALAANASAGIAWLGTGCLVVGALVVSDRDLLATTLALLVTGAACLVVVRMVLRRVDPSSSARNLTRLLVIETGSTVVGGLRLFLLFKVLGLSASPAQAVALTASTIIAAAVGVFPGGLGLRELIAGAIGAVVALPAGAAVAATALDRIATQLVLGLLAAVLLIPGRLTGEDEAAVVQREPEQR
jgi:hypothetical protein